MKNRFSVVVYLVVFCVSCIFLSCQTAVPKDHASSALVIFKSSDGGQSWQDISNGLPDKFQKDSGRNNSFFANEKGLFLKVGTEIYKSNPDATSSDWTETVLSGEDSSKVSGQVAMNHYQYWGVNLKKANGTSVWSPIFEMNTQPAIRSVFETASGSVFIGTPKGFFKSDDNGLNWKLVYAGTLVGNLAELDGVLLATNERKIIKSTDNGETWSETLGDNSVVWDVKSIKGGFAVITSGTESGVRTLKTSFNGGNSWQTIGAGNKPLSDSIWRTWNSRPDLPRYITSILQVGENFICVHKEGIYRSSDKGKSWSLLLPVVEDRAFNLMVSGNVIYAVSGKKGC